MTIKIIFKIETDGYHDGILWILPDDETIDSWAPTFVAHFGESVNRLENYLVEQQILAGHIAEAEDDEFRCQYEDCDRTFTTKQALSMHVVRGHEKRF